MSPLATLLAALSTALAIATTDASAAVVVKDLYEAQTLVTGTGTANRAIGIIFCFREVLAKVSGDPRLLNDPAVAALDGQAQEAVAGYHYLDRMAGVPIHDEQGSRDRPYFLTVDFAPDRIEVALKALGRHKWTAIRPRMVVVVDIQIGALHYLLASDSDHGIDQRQALIAASRQRGLPATLPSTAELAKAGLSPETLAAATPEVLAAVARAAGGDMALVGHLEWREAATLGWTIDWRMTVAGHPLHWTQHGITFDEAFRNGLGGALEILSGNGTPGA